MVVFKFDFDPKVVLIKADVFITLPERLKLHLGWLKETISPFNGYFRDRRENSFPGKFNSVFYTCYYFRDR